MVSGKSFDALLDAGINRQVQNDLAGAIALFREALAQRPEDAEALCLLGGAEHQAGQVQEGLARLERAVAAEPGEPRFRIQLALALSHGGDDVAAFGHLGAAAARIPISGEFARLLVQTGLRARAYTETVRAAQAWSRAEPGNKDALRVLSEAAFASGDFVTARTAVETIAGPEPSADDATALARINVRLNDPERATAHAERALALAPDSVAAMEVAAQIALYTGRAQEASVLAGRALERDPASVSALGTLLELPGRKTETVLDRARSMLTGGALEPSAAIALGYALARAFDANENYDAAYETARETNQRQAELRAGAGMQAADRDRLYALSSEIFDADCIAGIQDVTHASRQTPRPVFVVGPPRSGTSLTEKLLSSADKAAGLGERGALMPEFMRLLQIADAAGMEAAREAALSGAAQTARDERSAWAALAGPDHVVIDKTPAYLYAAGWLGALFPDARFVHLRRNRNDVIVSSFFQNLPVDYPYANRVDAMPDALDRAGTLARTWQDRLPAWFDFDYDAFVGDPAAQAQALFEFCSLDWTDSVLDPARPGGLRGFSAIAASGEITDSRRERWRNYARHFGW